VDDAGAGYASFSLIAALKPSVIKIDRDIVTGIARDDAKQALVEAFVSFGRRIGAQLLAEGIERRADLSTLGALGVDLGQGYLLGKPAPIPQPPRRVDPFRIRSRARQATGSVRARAGRGSAPVAAD
jgi:EAL domain-containing protein (putative c-di-GMP-specific phosphodiesterase class I)